MDLLQKAHGYFRGERREALWFVVPLGVAFAFYGAVALRSEQERMATVMTNFRIYRRAFLALAALGLLAALVPIDWARSAGAVLIVGGGLGLVIDGFAERRGNEYERALVSSAIEADPQH